MQVCQSADHFVTHEGASSQFSPRSSRNIGSSLIRPNNDGPYQLELIKMMFNSRFLAKRPDCLILPETLPRNIIQRSFVPVSRARARAHTYARSSRCGVSGCDCGKPRVRRYREAASRKYLEWLEFLPMSDKSDPIGMSRSLPRRDLSVAIPRALERVRSSKKKTRASEREREQEKNRGGKKGKEKESP